MTYWGTMLLAVALTLDMGYLDWHRWAIVSGCFLIMLGTRKEPDS